MDSILQHHDSLYFPDGNIILATDSKSTLPVSQLVDDTKLHWQNGVLLFRAHMSVLSLHSSVFKDMFESLGTADNEMHDGVPLVKMQDTVSELECFLKAMYCGLGLPAALDPNMPFKVQSVLKMATKYQADALRLRVVQHVEADWPTNFYAWEKLDARIQAQYFHCLRSARCDLDDDTPPYYLDDHLPEPASAIRLAREYNIPSILPYAFYHLASLSIRDDWDKMRVVPEDGGPIELERTQRTARWSLLSAEDWLCYQRGKHAMNLRESHSYGAHCPCNPPCNTQTTRGILFTIPPLKELENPFRYMCDIVVQYKEGANIDCCRWCANDMVFRIEWGKEVFWRQLNEWFELPETA